jgi:hypothetical protein
MNNTHLKGLFLCCLVTFAHSKAVSVYCKGQPIGLVAHSTAMWFFLKDFIVDQTGKICKGLQGFSKDFPNIHLSPYIYQHYINLMSKTLLNDDLFIFTYEALKQKVIIECKEAKDKNSLIGLVYENFKTSIKNQMDEFYKVIKFMLPEGFSFKDFQT